MAGTHLPLQVTQVVNHFLWMCFLFQSHNLDGFNFSFWLWTPMLYRKQVLWCYLRTQLGTWFPSSTCCIFKQGLWQTITNNENSWYNTPLYKQKISFLLGDSFSGTRLGCSDSIFNYLDTLFRSSVSSVVYEAILTPLIYSLLQLHILLLLLYIFLPCW